MSGKPRTTDADVMAMNEVYRIAEEKTEQKYREKLAEMKQLLAYEVLRASFGTKIKSERMREDFSRLLRTMFLRDTKEKLKEDGLWTRFCQDEGIDIKNADREIDKLGDFKDELLLSFAPYVGYEINKIKYLTSGDSRKSGITAQNGEVFCNGQKVELTPEDVQFVIDKLQDDLRLQKEDAEAQKKAFDRVQGETHKSLTKLEKELKSYKGFLEDKGINDQEKLFLHKIEFLKKAFDGFLVHLDPENIEELQIDKDPTPRMRAEYIAAVSYMKMQILIAYERAISMQGDCIMTPEDAPGNIIDFTKSA
jgi:hypothetical protein